MVAKLLEPEKELRFTRARQAAVFWILAAVFVATSLVLLASAAYRNINPALPHPGWALVPALAAIAAVRLAFHLTRHAYLILTPLGIEVFPFFRPAAGMRLILWQEISEAEVDEAQSILTLHHDLAKTSGLHLSLQPIPKERRALLAKAVTGRLSRPPIQPPLSRIK